MKIHTSLPLIAVAVATLTTGCISYTRQEPTRVVETVPTHEEVITTLPVGYTTRVVRGSRYYYYRNVYYREYPSGGYVVVTP